jgi:putrescine transport system permease protein
MLSRLKSIAWGRGAVLGIPYLWLILFFLIPFLIIFKISLAETQAIQSPFAAMLSWQDGAIVLHLQLDNYRFLGEDPLYLLTLLSSIRYALLTTILCLLIGYPFAYAIAHAHPQRRPLLLMLVVLPFWTSFLIRIYAWKGILASNGLLNQSLLGLGLISEPLPLLNTPFSLTLGMVYAYLPFMVLPLYSNLVKQDPRLLEAALDLGATPRVAFWRVTVPLSLSGIVAGALLVFIPAVGEFVIPSLLGGSDTLMIGRVLWDELFSNNDWPMASAVAVVLIVVVLAPFVLLMRRQEKLDGGPLA